VFYLGEFAAVCAHAQEGMTLYDPVKATSRNRWSDPRVAFLSYSAMALWFLGYADQALARSREALRLAQELADTHSRALGLGFASVRHGLLQRGEATQAFAETGIALARKVLPSGRHVEQYVSGGHSRYERTLILDLPSCDRDSWIYDQPGGYRLHPGY
jgi:hypothetical protein